MRFSTKRKQRGENSLAQDFSGRRFQSRGGKKVATRKLNPSCKKLLSLVKKKRRDFSATVLLQIFVH